MAMPSGIVEYDGPPTYEAVYVYLKENPPVSAPLPASDTIAPAQQAIEGPLLFPNIYDALYVDENRSCIWAVIVDIFCFPCHLCEWLCFEEPSQTIPPIASPSLPLKPTAASSTNSSTQSEQTFGLEKPNFVSLKVGLTDHEKKKEYIKYSLMYVEDRLSDQKISSEELSDLLRATLSYKELSSTINAQHLVGELDQVILEIEQKLKTYQPIDRIPTDVGSFVVADDDQAAGETNASCLGDQADYQKWLVHNARAFSLLVQMKKEEEKSVKSIKKLCKNVKVKDDVSTIILWVDKCLKNKEENPPHRIIKAAMREVIPACYTKWRTILPETFWNHMNSVTKALNTGERGYCDRICHWIEEAHQILNKEAL